MDQNTDAKRNTCVVVQSHGPINNSYSFNAENVYHAIMLQTFSYIADGN